MVYCQATDGHHSTPRSLVGGDTEVECTFINRALSCTDISEKRIIPTGIQFQGMSFSRERHLFPSWLRMASEEFLVVVDKQNQIIGTVSRKQVRRENLWHRASYVFVQSTRTAKLFVHQRTWSKDWCPGLWDCAAGGCVQPGESLEENAVRELQEEYGIQTPLESCGVFPFEDEHTRVWGGVFWARLDGEAADLTPQPEEVIRIEEMSLEDILKNASLFTKDSLFMLDKVAAGRF
jgi:isopentenyldiphosphate isomerase